MSFSDPTAREAYAAANTPAPARRFIATATINDSPPAIPGCGQTPGFVTVEISWHSTDGTVIDRPSTGGVSLPKKLAARAVAAINSQAIHGPASLTTDRAGKTFVSAGFLVLWRNANAELARFGF